MPRDEVPLITSQPTQASSGTTANRSPSSESRNQQDEAKCLQTVCNGFENLVEPSMGNIGAHWFCYSWINALLEAVGPEVKIDFIRILERKNLQIFNDQFKLITNASITDIVAGSIAISGGLSLLAQICQTSLECCQLDKKQATKSHCTCINCCHYTHSCLARLTNCVKVCNNIEGNPGYMWAHIDMCLTLANSSYRHSKVVHVLSASITSAVILFLLVMHVMETYNKTGTANFLTARKLAKLINTIGQMGVGRTGWMWAFYIMITTIFVPAFIPGFAIARPLSYVAPAIGLCLTGVSCAYNFTRPTNPEIEELTTSIKVFVSKYSAKISCGLSSCHCHKAKYEVVKPDEA